MIENYNLNSEFLLNLTEDKTLWSLIVSNMNDLLKSKEWKAEITEQTEKSHLTGREKESVDYFNRHNLFAVT